MFLKLRYGRTLRPLLYVALATALAGCGEDVTLEGGGAGDGDGDGTVDLAPFVGLWDITGNWNGIADDEAILAIGELEDNSAEARIYDFDDGGDNCHFRPVIVGEVRESVDARVFLDQIPEFLDAVLSLSNGDDLLTITFTDSSDIDDDNDNTDTVIYTAPRQPGLTETDLMICGAAG